MGDLVQMFPPEPQSIHAKHYETGRAQQATSRTTTGAASTSSPALKEYVQALQELVYMVAPDRRRDLLTRANRYGKALDNLAAELEGTTYGRI